MCSSIQLLNNPGQIESLFPGYSKLSTGTGNVPGAAFLSEMLRTVKPVLSGHPRGML